MASHFCDQAPADPLPDEEADAFAEAMAAFAAPGQLKLLFALLGSSEASRHIRNRLLHDDIADLLAAICHHGQHAVQQRAIRSREPTGDHAA